VLPDFEVRVAKFLKETVERVRTPDQPLHAPIFANAQLRHSRRVERDELAAAMLVAQRVAEAAIRNLRTESAVHDLPADPLRWRQELLARGRIPDLETVVADLWHRGIPVLHLEALPAPKFHGMALVLGNRPVIIVGHGQDGPAWLLFTIAHEAGHIARGHCVPDAPVVDATDETDTSEMEQQADAYAFAGLSGGVEPLAFDGIDARALAERADREEGEHRVDAGHLILRWAGQHATSEAFKTADRALKALWRKASGGKAILRRHFDANVDLERANDTDRALLSCAFLDPERNESSH